MVVVIANKKLPENKKISISLTSIFGIGITTSKKILESTKIDDKKTFELNQDEIKKIVREIELYPVESKLKEIIFKNKNEKIRIGTYQGKRLEKGLPVHGQSTRHNSQTAKKKGSSVRKRVAVTAKKKAPSPK